MKPGGPQRLTLSGWPLPSGRGWASLGTPQQSGALRPKLRVPSGLCVVLLDGYDGRKRNQAFPTRSPKHGRPEEAPVPKGVPIEIHVSLLMGLLGLRLSGERTSGRRAELTGAGSPQSARTENKGISWAEPVNGGWQREDSMASHSLTLGCPKGACWTSWCLARSAESSPRGTQLLSISHLVEFARLSGEEMVKRMQR